MGLSLTNLRLDILEHSNVMLKDTMTKRMKKIMAPNEPTTCPCGYSANTDEDFIWASLDGKIVLLCWGCSDKLHKNTLAKEKE